MVFLKDLFSTDSDLLSGQSLAAPPLSQDLPPDPDRALEQIAASQADAEAHLSKQTAKLGQTETCRHDKTTSVPCDIKSFKVEETRTEPNYLLEQKMGGSQTQVIGDKHKDDDDEETKKKKRYYPKTFTFDPSGSSNGEKYKSGSCIEFIGGDKVTGASTKVTVSFEDLYKCPKHFALSVTDPFGKTTVSPGVKSKALQLEYPSKWLPIQELPAGDAAPVAEGKSAESSSKNTSYWVWGFSPATWIVTAEVCGHRPPGEREFGSTTARIVVWPADKFSLEFSLPTRYQKKETKKGSDYYTNGARLHSESTESTTDKRTGLLGQNAESSSSERRASYAERGDVRSQERVTTTNSERIAYGNQSISLSNSETTRGGQFVSMNEVVTTTTGSLLGTQTTATQIANVGEGGDKLTCFTDRSGVVFSIKRGGRLLTSRYSQLKTILTLIDKIEDGLDKLRKFIRALGSIQYGVVYKFEWGFEVCAGTVTAEWGWAEWSDHRCYVACSATFTLTIISAYADVSIGVGLKLGALECSVSIGLRGSLAFTLEGKIERKGPDSRTDVKNSAKFGGSSSLELYAEAIAGHKDFASARGAVTVKATVEATPSIEKSGLGVDCSGKLEETIVSLDCHAAFVFKFKQQRKLVDETKLFSGHKVFFS